MEITWQQVLPSCGKASWWMASRSALSLLWLPAPDRRAAHTAAPWSRTAPDTVCSLYCWSPPGVLKHTAHTHFHWSVTTHSPAVHDGLEDWRRSDIIATLRTGFSTPAHYRQHRIPHFSQRVASLVELMLTHTSAASLDTSWRSCCEADTGNTC